jgi:hypothetical protein
LLKLVPFDVVTSTLTAPAACAGVTAVIVVSLTKEKLATGEPPIVTPVTPVKSNPVSVTDDPPAGVPELGDIALT